MKKIIVELLDSNQLYYDTTGFSNVEIIGICEHMKQRALMEMTENMSPAGSKLNDKPPKRKIKRP